MDGKLCIVVQVTNSLAAVGETKNVTDLLSHPPGFAVLVDDGGRSGLTLSMIKWGKGSIEGISWLQGLLDLTAGTYKLPAYCHPNLLISISTLPSVVSFQASAY